MNEDNRLDNIAEIAKLTSIAVSTANQIIGIKIALLNIKNDEDETLLLNKILILAMLIEFVFESHSNYIEAKNMYKEIKRRVKHL